MLPPPSISRMQSVAPQYAMQLLAPGLPGAAPTPSKQQRERAVEVLRQALWMMQLPEQRLQLMGGVRQALSAAEQVWLNFEGLLVPTGTYHVLCCSHFWHTLLHPADVLLLDMSCASAVIVRECACARRRAGGAGALRCCPRAHLGGLHPAMAQP